MRDFFALLVALVILCGTWYGISATRKKFPGVETYWNKGIIWLFIAYILIHLGIWWQWPNFWGEWIHQSGFLIFQILIGVGLYLKFGLKDKKFLKWFGLIVASLGLMGAGWNVWVAYSINHYATERMTAEELKNLPHQNKEMEKMVASFWKAKLPRQSALSMLRIIRRQSGFNQFIPGTKKPYRNPKFDNKRVGVMQIDDTIWSERASELDYNLDEMEGNLRFALWLYNEQGFEPWGGEPIRSIHLPWFPKQGEENTQSINDRQPSGSSRKPSPVSNNPNIPVTNVEGEKIAREFWGKEYSGNDLEEMVMICRLESGCNQFDPNNPSKPYTHRNDNGSTDVGIMMINKEAWEKRVNQSGAPPELKTYDINTLEGNLAAARYIRKNDGTKRWTTINMARLILYGTPYEIEAPTDGWSQKIPSVNFYSLSVSYKGKVKIRDDQGNIFMDDNVGKGVNVGNPMFTQIQSREETPLKISIKPFK